jgi:molybdopterin molybdotransferase
MPQLSEIAFGPNGSIQSIEQAVRALTERMTAVSEIELVPLHEADGRVIAGDIVAEREIPPFTNSAVDGYAVRGEDLPTVEERVFEVTGRALAGASAVTPIAAGHTIRVFTGAPLPAGADTVFMQEDVRVADAGRVYLPPGLERGANVRPAGEDVAAGRVILPAKRWLRPQDVAVAAALGLTHIPVRRRVRVAVVSTGDEIVEPGALRRGAQLFDSNRFMLLAMLRRAGCDATDLGIVRDDREVIARKLRAAAAAHDLILSSGGVSTGEGDHVKAAVESAGSLVFWRIAIKPGRPVAMGVVDGVPFIGLPGNPVASFVTFARVARPAIFALAGAEAPAALAVPVRAAFHYRKRLGRREYVRASLRKAADGSHEAIKFPREGAGLLSSLVDTDGLIELGETLTRIEPGQWVDFLTYASLL